jgi:hypothetical protein
MNFSVILQSPEVRQVVQSDILERAFHDALYPRNLFRGEATPVPWPAGVGDSMVFSAPGLMPVDMTPLVPGTDPASMTYVMEQWTSQLQQYSGSINTHMPTSMVAIANLFLRNAHQLGLQAAQTTNRKVRDQLYGAAMSGQTVVDGAFVAPAVTVRVKHLKGLTRSRRPDLVAGSPVRFDPVTASNPLIVTLFDNAVAVSKNIIAFNPDTLGDEDGPGTVTFDAAVVNVANRAYLRSSDCTFSVMVGGGNKVDDIGTTDVPTLADIRTAVAHFWQNNVPEHPDGRFHCHVDPISQSKVYGDAEFQRLMTALPDYYVYKQFALGEMLNTVFFRNSECPGVDTVQGGPTAVWDARDPFPGEVWNNGATTGVRIHRMLFTAQGAAYEYYSDLSQLLTVAGVTGKLAEPNIVNNGIEVMSDRIQLIIRAPQNKLMDSVDTSWKFIGDWPVRTDVATGDAARYKRVLQVVHGE